MQNRRQPKLKPEKLNGSSKMTHQMAWPYGRSEKGAVIACKGSIGMEIPLGGVKRCFSDTIQNGMVNIHWKFSNDSILYNYWEKTPVNS